MVLQRDLRHRQGKLDIFQHIVARLGMALNQLELDHIQSSGLGQYFRRHHDFSNIAQMAGDTQSLLPACVEAEPGANRPRNFRYQAGNGAIAPLDILTRLRRKRIGLSIDDLWRRAISLPAPCRLQNCCPGAVVKLIHSG